MATTELSQFRLKYRELRKDKISQEEWFEFVEWKKEWCGEPEFKAVMKEMLDNNYKASRRLKEYLASPLFRFRIRKYCNYHGYSDIEPYEVVRVISPRKVEIREMKVELVKIPSYQLGGFLAYTENDEQRWKCTTDESFPVETITLTKKGWGQGQYRMSDEPRKYYDYNF